jgi:hypothetical protein
MKYLKRYEEAVGVRLKSELKSTVEDLLIELRDDDFVTLVSEVDYHSQKVKVKVNIQRDKEFTYSDIKLPIESVWSYLSEEGFEIEETDFLFIDTLHAYAQLKKELEMHALKAKKFIAFHDTVSYGERDEDNYTGVIQKKHEKQGLNAAINEFLESNPQWSIEEVFTNNNGLTVLKRK